jgi:transposase
MAHFYVGGDRDQQFLLPVSMADWLEEGHLAWFVIDVVSQIDTARFHARHPNDGPGRPAYDPDMMLALLFYAYGTGMRSSRRIEAACTSDAAYRVICGSVTPDHATICRFVCDHEQAIEETFVQVLRLCHAAGLVQVGTIAIDGTKMAADAALDQNHQADWLRAEVARILAEARSTDADEDAQAALLGPAELPALLATKSGRLARLQAALAEIEAQDAAQATEAKARADKARAAAAEGRKLTGRKPKDPHAALARAEAEHAAALVAAERRAAERAKREAAEAAAGRKLRGRAPGPDRVLIQATAALEVARAAAAEAPAAARVANTTDPDSRIMKTAKGWVQGYNAQAAANEHQVVVSCAVTQDANDVGQYQPMVAKTEETLGAVGVTEPLGLVLADAGYWSEDNATAAGPDRLIATLKDWKQRRAAREMGTTTGPPPQGATPLEAMEHRLRTAEGAAAYATRSHTIEPIFGDHKENRGWTGFRRRGIDAVRSEWAFMNASHNLAKLFTRQCQQQTSLA